MFVKTRKQMKKFLALLLWAMALPCISQITATDNFKHAPGKPYEVFDFDDVYYFQKDNQVLSLKIIRNKALVQKFDAIEAKCLNAKRYDGFFPSGFIVESMEEIAGNYYFFYSTEGKNQSKLFAQEIDFKSGEFTGEPKEVASFESELATIEKIGYTKEKVKRKFNFKAGFGNKSLLVSCRFEPKVSSEKKNFDIVGLRLLGKDLVSMLSKEVTMPYTERMMDNLDCAQTADGKVFLLAKVFDDESAQDKKSDDDVMANFHLELFSVSANSELQKTRFDNKDKLFTQLTLVPDAKGVSGIGFYTSGKDVKYNKGFFNNKLSDTYDIDGIVFFKVSESGEFGSVKYDKIPDDVANAHEKPKTQLRNEEYIKSGNGAKIQFLNIRQALAQPDGGIFIGAEQYFLESNSGPSMNSYNYNNILVARLSENDDLVWARKIPKFQSDQSGINDKSYQYFFEDQKHYVVYLDNPENKFLAPKSFPEHYNSSKQDFVTAAIVEDTSGKTTKNYVFDIDGMPFRMEKFAVRRIFPDGDKGFLVESYKKDKEDILVKVSAK